MLQRWEAIWVVGSSLLKCKGAFIGKTCVVLLTCFWRNVLFASRTKAVHRSHVGFCNRLRILTNVSSMFLWISLLTCPRVHVGLMLFLLLLTGSHVLSGLCLVIVLWQLRLPHSCFLNTGSVALVCRKRLLAIGTPGSLVLFGSHWLRLCHVALHYRVGTILKQMGSPNVFIVL